jgi:hypothetical protein
MGISNPTGLISGTMTEISCGLPQSLWLIIGNKSKVRYVTTAALEWLYKSLFLPGRWAVNVNIPAFQTGPKTKWRVPQTSLRWLDGFHCYSGLVINNGLPINNGLRFQVKAVKVSRTRGSTYVECLYTERVCARVNVWGGRKPVSVWVAARVTPSRKGTTRSNQTLPLLEEGVTLQNT